MSNQLSITLKGEIVHIGAVKQVSDSFRKRDLVIDTGGEYPQSILMQVTQDRVELLEAVNVGTQVECQVNIRGRKWTSPEGEEKYFTSLEAWRVVSQSAQPVSSVSSGDLPF